MNGYSNEQRTKNLTLRDIHVGDWVQVWRPLPKEYTPPMKVSSIHYDGTVYLVSDDEGHCNPYEANIKDIDALPITPDLLKGFGFKIESTQTGILKHTDYHLIYHWGSILLKTDNSSILCEGEFFQELQQFLDSIGEMSDFEWKGVDKHDS